MSGAQGTREVDCCIAGGGPAGVVLALMLARAGRSVVLLEKHADFLRDFRGDTLHPSTLQVMVELGLADELLRLPHTRIERFEVPTAGGALPILDLSRLRTPFPFVALMPQWDFLTFLVDQARVFPGFDLRMASEATGLLFHEGRVVGLRYRDAAGERELRCRLVVAADGRGSTLRAAAGLPSRRTSPPMDVLWFRLSRGPEDTPALFARLGGGHLLVFVNRGSYWQVGAVIPKGSWQQLQTGQVEHLRSALRLAVPEFADRAGELRSWEDVKLLEVRADRLRRWWRPGLLAIGDAAHAMSPIGGVGINLAIQDAVVTANRLAGPLEQGVVTDGDLRGVQRRRQPPTIIVQSVQWLAQRGIVALMSRASGVTGSPQASAGQGQIVAPRALVLLLNLPIIRAVPSRVFALGVVPVHARLRASRPTGSAGQAPAHPRARTRPVVRTG